MKPGKYNMVCPQGSTFNITLTWKIGGTPVNLNGYTARMQAKPSYKANCNSIFNITTENGGISLDNEGNINLVIEASTTEGFVPRDYVYDLELAVDDQVYRILEGKFIVTPEVTK